MDAGGFAAARRTGHSVSSPDELLDALRRLDRILEPAVELARAAFGPEAVADPFKGLHVSTTDARRLLSREPGAPLLWTDARAAGTGPDPGSRLAWVARTFALCSFDIDVLLLALASELDLRYERIFAFLQNDVTRRRPSVELALDLLCSSTAGKLARRARFSPDAPLLRHGLIELVPEPARGPPSLLAQYLKLDDQLVGLLLGQNHLDARLVHCCDRRTPATELDELPVDVTIRDALGALAAQVRGSGRPVQIYLQGPSANDQRRVAEALAGAIGAQLLVVDLPRIPTAGLDFERGLKLVLRQAWFEDAVLHLENVDELRSEDRARQLALLTRELAEHGGTLLLSGTQPWVPVGETPVRVITMPVAMPGFPERRRQWQARLAAHGMAIDEQDLDSLSSRFRLSASQIAQSVVTAQEQSRLPRPEGSLVTDLFAAARAQCGHDLAVLTRKIRPSYRWADIVLPADRLAQLREICERAAHRHRVMDDWGFERKLSLGKGVNALFAGPSGTGKTMAAEIIAHELGLDLYKIDLSVVVSKYIGETEKNLDRIFVAAENANGILFFDEADALFGKRSEVHDAHDRYANLEISYLLQKMEQHEGIAILASNLPQNMDGAFVRRLAFAVHFPFPDEADRQRIWTEIWPAATPLAEDVDVDFLAHQFKLSGGNIKNIALASAFLAAADGGVVTMAHVRHATQREYQKLGKVLSAAELNGNGGSGHV